MLLVDVAQLDDVSSGLARDGEGAGARRSCRDRRKGDDSALRKAVVEELTKMIRRSSAR